MRANYKKKVIKLDNRCLGAFSSLIQNVAEGKSRKQ